MARRRLLAAIAVLAVSASLFGCDSARDASSTGGQITISFAHWGANEEAATIATMIKAFEKANPSIKVTNNWIQSDYLQKLTTSVAGGQAPDVAMTSNAYLPDLQSVLRTADVKPSDYYTANVPDSMKYEGKYYGLPFVIKPKVMAVNNSLFQKNNVPTPSQTVPMPVASFEQAAKKLTSGSGKSKIYGSAPLWFNGWLKAEGGDFFAAGGKCTIDSPAAVAAANLMIRAQSAGGFAPTLLDAQGQDMFYWLSVGRLAMQPDFGPWDIAKLVGLKSPNYQLVPVPGNGSLLEVNGLSILKAATPEKAAAAATFLTFMSTNTAAQSLLTTTKSSLGVPVTTAGVKSFEATAPNLNLHAFVIAAGQSALGVSVKRYSDITGNISTALSSRTAIGSGHQNPADVLRDLQSKCPSGLATSS